MNIARDLQRSDNAHDATRSSPLKVGAIEMVSPIQTLFLGLTILLRAAIGSLIISVAHETFRVSTSQALLILGLLSGIIIGSLSALTRLRSYVVPTLLCALFLGTNGLFHILQIFFPFTEGGILLPYSTLLDWNLICYVFAFGFSTTWLFWRVRYFGTFEVLVGLLLSVGFFSLHRDFQFALAPKMVQRLAWELNTSSFSLLIILAGVITIITVSYLGVTGHPGAPFARPREKRPVFVQGGRRPVVELFGYGIILLCISLVSRGVYSYYLVAQESLGANGVGQRSTEESIGKSPLGFHSALGSNNQPAAVVRLSGDYPENPHSPMLYLREGALSAFNGRELVEAAEGFDDDVPGTAPSEFFRGQERMEYFERVPIPHSVYLLSDHNVVFTIDYPVSVEPLENPAPERFRGVYRAYSIAPSSPLSALLDKRTGNPDWSLEQKNFYLSKHSDTRYEELAHTIIATETNPAARASLLVEYLNKNAIYTLSPNHEVDPTADPVAPFLFGDMRGYCVHFAHATTYMLRALGIPARIATGYLTDLSQARDGHILLRMSDRHAWAEAYFEGAGWIPFDTQPEQVESHADSEVDVQLLEELMGLIGPENTLIPPEAYEGENAFEKPSARWIPSILSLLMFIVGAYVLLLIRKFFIWHGWHLPGTTIRRIHRAHRALSVRLEDYGYPRAYAETHHEHLNRLSRTLGVFPTHIWQLSHKLRYADTAGSRDEIQGAIVADRKELSQLPRYKRFLSFFHPLNLLHG
jgi:hypothetical protein